jgi:hypothetical protein
MKRLFLLLLFAAPLMAQSFTLTGTQCATVAIDGKATVALQVLGSWSGTIQPKAAIAGQTTANLQATPVASTTLQSTITTSGAYVANITGYSIFQVCGATITGTAKIYVNSSRFTH